MEIKLHIVTLATLVSILNIIVVSSSPSNVSLRVKRDDEEGEIHPMWSKSLEKRCAKFPEVDTAVSLITELCKEQFWTVEDPAGKRRKKRGAGVDVLPPPCFFRCLFQQANALDKNGKVNLAAIAAGIEMIFPGHAAYISLAKKAFATCAENYELPHIRELFVQAGKKEGNSDEACFPPAMFLGCAVDSIVKSCPPPK